MHLVVVFAGLFLVVFALSLFALTVALFVLEVVFPQLVSYVAVDVREDNAEDVRVPRYWLAFDAFFDVL